MIREDLSAVHVMLRNGVAHHAPLLITQLQFMCQRHSFAGMPCRYSGFAAITGAPGVRQGRESLHHCCAIITTCTMAGAGAEIFFGALPLRVNCGVNLLALETSTRHLSVALWRDGDCIERAGDVPNGGSERCCRG